MKAHLINCTYCIHRVVTPGEKKRSIGELERCRLTMTTLKHPSQPGRFCEQFQQIGHDCESCYRFVSGVDNYTDRLVFNIDKVREL